VSGVCTERGLSWFVLAPATTAFTRHRRLHPFRVEHSCKRMLTAQRGGCPLSVRLASWQTWRGSVLLSTWGGCFRAGALAAGQPAEAGGNAAVAASDAQAAEASGAAASAGPAAASASGAEAEGATYTAADAPGAAAGAEAAGAAGPGGAGAAEAGAAAAASGGAPAAAAPAQAADPPAKIGYRTFRSGNEASAYFQDLIHNLTRDQDLNEARPARRAPRAAHAGCHGAGSRRRLASAPARARARAGARCDRPKPPSKLVT
jgi:hypothetical protein